jgi:hypothetical protein
MRCLIRRRLVRHALIRDCFFALAFLAGLAAVRPSHLSGADSPPKNPALQTIIQRLAAQEQIVKSGECLLTHRSDATDPKMVLRIKELLRKHRRPAVYIVDKPLAAKETYVIHWWRKGKKERSDQFRHFDDMSQPGALPTRSAARDGPFARSYFVRDKPNPLNNGLIEGTIQPAQRFINDDLPFAFLYEYLQTPYSEILARSNDAKVTPADGKTMVSFSHPQVIGDRFVLTFDRDGTLVQRDLCTRHPQENASRINQRERFSGYRTYRSSRGESVRFPSEVDYDFVFAVADDGQLIVYLHVHIDVSSFRFNHDIPDGLFKLKFPDGCAVFDAINRNQFRQGQ